MMIVLLVPELLVMAVRMLIPKQEQVEMIMQMDLQVVPEMFLVAMSQLLADMAAAAVAVMMTAVAVVVLMAAVRVANMAAAAAVLM